MTMFHTRAGWLQRQTVAARICNLVFVTAAAKRWSVAGGCVSYAGRRKGLIVTFRVAARPCSLGDFPFGQQVKEKISPWAREGLQRKSFFAACGKKDWSGKPGFLRFKGDWNLFSQTA
jgi:hypothetical protein